MAVFERMNVLHDKEILELDVIEQFYAYRVKRIVQNPRIRQLKLVDQAEGWRHFIALWKKLSRGNGVVARLAPYPTAEAVTDTSGRRHATVLPSTIQVPADLKEDDG